MNKQEFLALLDKYLEGAANDEEIQLLLRYYNSFQQSATWTEAELGSSRIVKAKLLQRLQAALAEQQPAVVVPIYRHTWFRIAAAAVLVFVLAGSIWRGYPTEHNPTVAQFEKIKPLPENIKGTAATLILTDGRVISLDSITNGFLAQQGHTQIIMQDGKLVYETTGNSLDKEPLSPVYNTLATPKGVQCQVVLPDGSQVWLNAATALRIPVAFTGKERSVDVTGEAYFEIAKDADRPFRVHAAALSAAGTKEAVVEVLGTHFNISAYDDEASLKTTLLEGQVKVTPVHQAPSATDKACLLMPGQQAQITAPNTAQTGVAIQAVNVENVVAWKNKLFDFNTADIETIMREIARWYDVEVVYEGKVPMRNFSGKISRNTDLAVILKILEQSNIRFRMKGKKIIVLS